MYRQGNTIYGVVQNSGNVVSYNKALKLLGGNDITDEHCDGVVYRKLGNEYFKLNCEYVTPEMYGAIGNGIANDYEAISNMFVKCKDCNIVFNKEKVYKISNESGYLEINDFSGTVSFSNLLFTNNTNGALKFVNSNSCVVKNTNLDFVSTPSVRNSNYGIYFYRCSNVTLNNTCVKNTSGAGVLFLECIKPKVYNLTVENSLADGLHFANCEKPIFDLINTNNTGDDGVALVNYSSALNYTGGEGTRIFVKNSAARGIAVVGQSNVNIQKFTVDDTSSGGIYIAQEGAYNTRTPENVTFSDGVINNAGCYGLGVGNRFGISYNNCGPVYLKKIVVNGAYSRGFSGISNSYVNAQDIEVNNTVVGDAANLKANNLVIDNIRTSECNGYGLWVDGCYNYIAKNITIKNASKGNPLNRAFWFSNNATVDVNGINVIDDQALPTGHKFGESSNLSGNIQNITTNIKNGNSSYQTLSSGVVFQGKPTQVLLNDKAQLSTNNTFSEINTFSKGIAIPETTNGRTGRGNMTSGVLTKTVNTATTQSIAEITCIALGGTWNLTVRVVAVCTANTLTITAYKSDGTINTGDTSTYTYNVKN